MAGCYRIIPNPVNELYFNFTRIHLISKGYIDTNNPTVHLAGMQEYDQESFTCMSGSERGGGFVVVFRPLGFYKLFGIKSADFCKYVLNGISPIDSSFDDTRTEMLRYHGAEDMKRVFETRFMARAVRADRDLHRINLVLEDVERCHGIVRINHLAKKYNLSARTLQRDFKQEIGISLKEILQIFRINRAIRLLSEKPDSDLTEISYLSGYYDQAHFTKDLKRITNLTPGQKTEIKKLKESQVWNRLFVRA